MLWVILGVFALAILAPYLYHPEKKTGFAILAVLSGSIFVYFSSLVTTVLANGSKTFHYSWIPDLGIHLSFFADGLSLFFALLISLFGLLILLYARGYLAHEGLAHRFFGYLIFFEASMLGLVMSDNLVSLFVFWELTSLSSFLLIGFKNQEEASRKYARQALLVTAAGGLVLMVGFILMGIEGGSFNIQALIGNADALRSSPYITSILILVLIGAFSKSAQFPFHFWLPNAMAAPTPVSAYLHSATMVKVGVFLVFRLNPIFKGLDWWNWPLLIVGGFTMVMGAIVAFHADDLKRVLAYTTISALGIFFFMIGIGSEVAIQAAMVYVLAHALYKGALFLMAGTLDHECGTRKLSELIYIEKDMPWTKWAAILAGLSMAGIIPFLGFTGKELLYDAALHANAYATTLMTALIVSSMFFIGVTLKILHGAFFNKKFYETPSAHVHEAPGLMFVPPVLMGVLSLVFAIIPYTTIQPLLEQATFDMGIPGAKLGMGLWHGFTPVLILSLLTIVLGILLYLVRKPIQKAYQALNLPLERWPEWGYNGLMTQAQNLAEYHTRIVQNGYLRTYLFMLIFTFCGLVLYHFIGKDFLYNAPMEMNWSNLRLYEMSVFVLVGVTLIFLFNTTSRFTDVAAIGIIGYGIAILYTVYSAPDVAITQFLAETLSLILLILISPKIPHLNFHKTLLNFKYLILSVIFGGIMAVITLIGMSRDINSPLKQYFLDKSIPKGKGENVVNVILVDFRALDTLGEISVLVITLVGIVALMKIKRPQLKQD